MTTSQQQVFRLLTFLSALLLCGCTGDNFNGGFRLKEQPQDYGTNVLRRAPSPVGEQFVRVPVRVQRDPSVNARPAFTRFLLTWDYTFSPPELTTFKIYALTNLNVTNETLIAVVSNTTSYVHWLSNAPMMAFIVRAKDRDMPQESAGWHK